MPKIENILPTHVDQQSWQTIISDHLPLLYKIPTKTNDLLPAISLNVLPQNFFSGFADSEHTEQNFVESNELYQARRARIIDLLSQNSQQHNCSLICLQEADPELNQQLLLSLGKSWQMYAEDQSVPIFYNSTVMQVEQKDAKLAGVPYEHNMISLKYHQEVIHIHNAHLPHANNAAEPRRSLLAAFNSDAGKYPLQTSVILGDFNYRIHKIDRFVDNASNVIPLPFRAEAASNYDYTDGAFIYNWSDESAVKPEKVYQLAEVVIDPQQPNNFYQRENIEAPKLFKAYHEVLFPASHKISEHMTYDSFLTKLTLWSKASFWSKLKSIFTGEVNFDLTNCILYKNRANYPILHIKATKTIDCLEPFIRATPTETGLEYRFDFIANLRHQSLLTELAKVSKTGFFSKSERQLTVASDEQEANAAAIVNKSIG
jgi:hypothetical protein